VGSLERRLNDPRVVLVVGAVAVALNVLLYFGVFLPRAAPLIGQISSHVSSIGASFPEAVGGPGPTSAGSNPEARSKPRSEASSHAEAGSKSVPKGSHGSLSDWPNDPAPGSPPNPPQDSPSGSPPVSPSQQQSSASARSSPPSQQQYR
jgi:hypothetical protein